MNKFIIFLVVLFLVFVGYYFVKKNVIETKSVLQDSGEILNEGNLKIIESRVSYMVDKIFFTKPLEKITGTTKDIKGNLNYDKNIISANLVVPTLNIKTDSDKRDEDVRKIIGEAIRIEVKKQDMIFPFKGKIPISITIGAKTNELMFDISAKNEGDMIILSGKSMISMKLFEIEAPSMFGVYQVSDLVELSFELKAGK